MVTWVGPTRDPNAAGNPFDNYVNAFSSIQNMQKQQDETALRNYLAQHGPSILGGDENALRGLASQPGGLEAAAGAQEMNQERNQQAAAMLGRMILDVETPDQFEQAKEFAGRAGLVPPEKLSAYTFNDLPQLKRMVADSGNDWQRYRNVPGVGLVDLGAIGPDGRPTVVYEQPETLKYIEVPGGYIAVSTRGGQGNTFAGTRGGQQGGASGGGQMGAEPAPTENVFAPNLTGSPGDASPLTFSRADAAAEQAAAVERAKLQVKEEFESPEKERAYRTAEASYNQAQNRFKTAAEEALDILKDSQVWGGINTAAGYGIALQDLPMSAARALKARLQTMKANLGFDELKTMRESSKTGAALGSVTERELAFLQSVEGALDQGLHPADLAKTIQDIINRKKEFNAQRQAVLSSEPGRPDAPAAPAALENISTEELLRMRGQ